MSTINGKLGLKPAGKRPMMKLPKDTALRNRITSAVCPKCGGRGARLSKVVVDVPTLVCSWCPTTWPLDPPTEAAS